MSEAGFQRSLSQEKKLSRGLQVTLVALRRPRSETSIPSVDESTHCSKDARVGGQAKIGAQVGCFLWAHFWGVLMAIPLGITVRFETRTG